VSSKLYCDKCSNEIKGESEKVLVGDLFDDDRDGMGWKDLCPTCFGILKKWFGIK